MCSCNKQLIAMTSSKVHRTHKNILTCHFQRNKQTNQTNKQTNKQTDQTKANKIKQKTKKQPEKTNTHTQKQEEQRNQYDFFKKKQINRDKKTLSSHRRSTPSRSLAAPLVPGFGWRRGRSAKSPGALGTYGCSEAPCLATVLLDQVTSLISRLPTLLSHP